MSQWQVQISFNKIYSLLDHSGKAYFICISENKFTVYFSSSFTGKFHSKAVVEALLDLLYDRDNNIRAIAAISLAKAGENSPKIVKSLMKCLNDKDRLVREGTCLALGHLKAQQAVTKILHLW